jgi:hypothetical protein
LSEKLQRVDRGVGAADIIDRSRLHAALRLCSADAQRCAL